MPEQKTVPAFLFLTQSSRDRVKPGPQKACAALGNLFMEACRWVNGNFRVGLHPMGRFASMT
jgi:hypothetical protein